MYKVIVIPADESQPIREELQVSYMDYSRLIFGHDGGPLGISSFRSVGMAFVYDDNGLRRASAAQSINARAMQLWGHLTGRGVQDIDSPLVGTYLVIGVHGETGEDRDVPKRIEDILAEMKQEGYWTVIPRG